MGIQNRDYYRADSRSGGWSMPNGRSMCQNILISTVVVFVIQLLFNPLINTWGSLEPYKVVQGQLWRLVTYAFLHDTSSVWHIVFNMLVLYFFGPVIEELWGRREFLAFYLTAAVASGLCHLAFGMAMHDPKGAVGASGAVMGVMMAFAFYYPRHLISIFMIFPLEARWVMAIYLVYDALPILNALGGRGSPSDGIAHAAHLGGLAFGYLYCKSGWKLTGWFETRGGPSLGKRLTRWWTRPPLKVYQSPVERPGERTPSPQYQSPRDLEHQVDAILKKIKDEGEASLTDEERRLLSEASRAYKKQNT